MNKHINIPATQSLILRYGNDIKGVKYEFLEKASILEGARIIPLTSYKEVNLSLLDLSTESETKTFKSSLACVTIGHCLENNIERIVFQSSGNTANALTAYAKKQHIQTILLYIPASRYKLEPQLYDNNHHIAIECDVTEPKLKELLQLFGTTFAVEIVPHFDHQIESNKVRANFLLDHYQETGQWFEWQAQSISTGYGIFGLYQGFKDLKDRHEIPAHFKLPRLLGVQQSAFKPYTDEIRKLLNDEPIPSENGVLEPTLFRSKITTELRDTMLNILKTSSGMFEIVNVVDYAQYHEKAQSILEQIGIKFGVKIIDNQEKIIEKSGLLALIGALKAIDNRRVQSGSSILIVFTGGTKAFKDTFTPQYQLADINIEREVIALGDKLNLPRRKS